jgi:sulfhydrogenase subunit beta (sulfur reductase)
VSGVARHPGRIAGSRRPPFRANDGRLARKPGVDTTAQSKTDRNPSVPDPGSRLFLDVDAFGALLDGLRSDGFELFGPTAGEGAIVLAAIAGIGDLPAGVGDEQAPGRYRLRERGDGALFGYAASPHSWKRELFPPRVELLTVRRREGRLSFGEPPRPTTKRAFVGARACEIAAMGVHDRVLRDGAHADPDYAARRAHVFVLAVHCGSPAGTCFCASMGTGPRATEGFDLAATELLTPVHGFLVEVGSQAGSAAIARVAWRAASAAEEGAAGAIERDAVAHMGRRMDTRELPGLLLANLEHPRWLDVADRCLGCANCTLACPTCFCSGVEDATDLPGDVATRTRRWDSCFTCDFAHVHGGSARPSLRARYRQWLTHKLATWHEQFGESGCVGCGRCITWCPVGIDITEEVAAIRGATGTRSHDDG